MTIGLLACAALALSLGPSAPVRMAGVSVTTMDGRAISLNRPRATRPLVLMVWRPDCAPCLVELEHLRELQAHAGRMRILPLGLGSAATLQPALRRIGLQGSASLRTSADPAKVLLAFNGPPPRLPLSVALDPGGRICGRHLGLLGEDQVAAWARRCGGGVRAQG